MENKRTFIGDSRLSDRMHQMRTSLGLNVKKTFIPHRQRGFTLIEILIVMSIIVALLAMLLPAMGSFRTRSQIRQTEAMLSSLVAAMTSYGSSTVIVDNTTGAVRRLWYFTGSGGVLDGDPALDPAYSVADRQLAEQVGYNGPARMLPGAAIPNQSIEQETGRIIDPWGQPIRVLDAGDPTSPYAANAALIVSQSGISLWSSGPDGDPSTTDDNITSWSSKGVK